MVQNSHDIDSNILYQRREKSNLITWKQNKHNIFHVLLTDCPPKNMYLIKHFFSHTETIIKIYEITGNAWRVFTPKCDVIMKQMFDIWCERELNISFFTWSLDQYTFNISYNGIWAISFMWYRYMDNWTIGHVI